MTEDSYTVHGMACEHCARAVTEEVGKIEGAREVVVDLPTGMVTVTSARPLRTEDVGAAVDEAGYELSV